MAPTLHKTGIKTHRGSSISLWSISLAEAPDLDGLILNNREAADLYGGWKPERSERKVKDLSHTHSSTVVPNFSIQ